MDMKWKIRRYDEEEEERVSIRKRTGLRKAIKKGIMCLRGRTVRGERKHNRRE